MIPGPELIKECPHCHGNFKEGSIESGNTFGATYWTDGKREAPMLPDQEWLLVCPHCGAGFWSDDLEPIDALDFYHGVSESLVEKYSQTPSAKTPSISDLHQALFNETEDNERIEYLRIKIWWTGNDVRRENPDGPAMTVLEKENLVALIPLLGQDERDEQALVMKAEALRELGRFDDALNVLDKITNERLVKTVDQIRQLAGKGDWVVRKVFLKR